MVLARAPQMPWSTLGSPEKIAAVGSPCGYVESAVEINSSQPGSRAQGAMRTGPLPDARQPASRMLDKTTPPRSARLLVRHTRIRNCLFMGSGPLSGHRANGTVTPTRSRRAGREAGPRRNRGFRWNPAALESPAADGSGARASPGGSRCRDAKLYQRTRPSQPSVTYHERRRTSPQSSLGSAAPAIEMHGLVPSRLTRCSREHTSRAMIHVKQSPPSADPKPREASFTCRRC